MLTSAFTDQCLQWSQSLPITYTDQVTVDWLDDALSKNWIQIMALPISKQILIVGDGNFSFSVFFMKHCLNGNNLTATSLDCEEVLFKNPDSVNNLRELQSSGKVTVLHRVDCTKLQLYFCGRKFDEIVFNFPHCGGKSNVRKCRDLLRLFFASAAHHLNPDGQVRVTLCRGQGGTPSDDRTRGYSNSWKIATAAAYAGLVLVSVQPFSGKGPCLYTCAGYRGKLEKGFVLERALTHSFKVGCALPRLPVSTIPSKDKLDSLLLKRLQLQHKSGSLFHRLLSELACRVCCDLARGLESTADFECQDRHSSNGCQLAQDPHLALDELRSANEFSGTLLEVATNDKIEETVKVILGRNSRSIIGATEAFCDHIILYATKRRHAVKAEQKSLVTKGVIQSLVGDCAVEASSFKCERNLSSLSCFLHEEPMSATENFDAKVVPYFLEDLGPAWDSMTPEITVTAISDEHLAEDFGSVQYRSMDWAEYSFSDVEKSYMKSSPLSLQMNSHCVFHDIFDIKLGGRVLARGGVANCAKSRMEKTDNATSDSLFFVLMPAERILACRYKLSDLRILASSDQAFLENILHNLKERDPVVVGPSLIHPLCYRHDLCFWLSYDISEELLMDTIRTVADDLIHSVKLLRILNHQESCAVSYCYRLIYSRCDGPLTKEDTVHIQNELRLVLLKFGFNLR